MSFTNRTTGGLREVALAGGAAAGRYRSFLGRPRKSPGFRSYCRLPCQMRRITLHNVKCPNPECKRDFQLKSAAEPGSPMHLFSLTSFIYFAKQRKIKCPRCGHKSEQEKPMV